MRTATSLALLAAFSWGTAPLSGQRVLPHLAVPAVAYTTPLASASVGWDLAGVPNALFVVLVDVSGGPIDLLGERFQLGLTPALGTLASGQLPAFGQALGTVQVQRVGALLGVPFYLQAVVLNPAARNGAFEASNGESAVLLAPTAGLVDRFDHAAIEGFTGNFDALALDQLRGGAVLRRTHRTVDPQGVSFGAPIATPLNHYGARGQLCFRAVDLGATGAEELVTAIRWRLFGGRLVPDRFDRFELRLSHTLVVPDYTIDPWSALPRFPASGLDPVYANNVKPGETPLLAYSGPYGIGANDLRADGYVDYPIAQPFAYDGVDSLLVDLWMTPSAVPGSGANGQVVRLMCQSSPQPNARVVGFGRVGAPFDPSLATTGQGDNAMYDYQVEFARVKTVALSRWRAGPTPRLDYQAPIVAKVEPRGTSVAIDFRGADDAQGNGATVWSANVDVADGKAFLQYRVTFVGDAATGEVPALDTLIVPVL